MPNITKKTNAKLVQDLKRIIEKGRLRAVEETKKIMLETYWLMGERIGKDGPLEHGESRQIAQELNLDESLLARIMRFYFFWPKSLPTGPNGQVLSWSHYKILVSVEDKKQRDFYLKQAFKNKWNRPTLSRRIQEDFYEEHKTIALEMKGPGKLKPKTSGYLYAAILEWVVDGDTFVLRIDLGFKVWINQRIRLRGINCPELKFPEGKAIREYVTNALSHCEVIAIRSFKQIDIYGRYVCDLFYLSDSNEKDKTIIAQEGIFLNQQLLDEGHAVLI